MGQSCATVTGTVRSDSDGRLHIAADWAIGTKKGIHHLAPQDPTQSDTAELNAQRRTLLQMLFVEGNHFCPSCEKSGDCLLQATAYEMEMAGPLFEEFYPDRAVDASHPDVLLDLNRCILCALCVRASATMLS